MIQNISTDKISDVIRDVAAKRIIPRWRSLKDDEINTKSGPNDLVTAADIEAEEDLTAFFLKEFPGCGVVGEEAVSRGEIDLENTFANPPELLWVIDPVDGTWNFAHGSEIFGCMVALLYKGETVMSWIYDVPKETFATAEKGQGAFYGEERLKVNGPKSLEAMHGFISQVFAPKDTKKVWEHQSQYVATAGWSRCAAHSYMRLCRGLVDFHISTKTRPWDHLMGELLVHEAGGMLRSWDKEAYHPLHFRQGLLTTGNAENWNALYSLLIEPVLQFREIET